MTLNEIAERVAYGLQDPFNVMLKNNIKFSIKNWRALLIRRDIFSNGTSPEYLQKIKVNLIKVNKGDTCNLNLDCTKVLKSENQIPQFIRWKNDVPFKFVGNYNGKSFTYTEYEELPYTCYNRFTSSTIRYCLINHYLYIFNNTKLKYTWIEHIFVDPYQANILCEGCFDDDSFFPFPADLVQQFIVGVMSGEFKITSPLDEGIKVEDETK